MQRVVLLGVTITKHGREWFSLVLTRGKGALSLACKALIHRRGPITTISTSLGEKMFEPTHMSYSSLSQYERCPRSYYLSKVRKAEERQTWFFPVGTAVHESIEAYISTGDVPDVESILFPLLESQMKIDPDDVNWLSGGSADEPIIRDRAIQLARDCVENAVTFLEDIDVYEIEYDATGNLPGCPVPVKAYVDLIGEHKKYGPSIVDWKTSASKPKDATQLETYAALLKNKPQFKDYKFKGLWGMLRPGVPKARAIDLSAVDAAALGERYGKAYERIVKGLWPTEAGYNCKFCTQSPNCLLEAGPTDRARYYDRAHEDGVPY